MDDKRIRPGLIYRSESLAELTDQDLSTVASLGIRLICYLRSSHERRQFPSRWPETPPGHHPAPGYIGRLARGA